MNSSLENSQVSSDSVKQLSIRQQKAITFLISSATQEEACRRAQVSRETVNTWRKDPLFLEELEKQRQAVYAESMGILKQTGSQAVITLQKLLSSENEGVRLKACVACILLGLKVRKTEQLEGRIRQLESLLKFRSYRSRVVSLKD